MKTLFALVLFSPALLIASSFHVTTTGSPSNPGTLASPWDLAKGLGMTDNGNPSGLNPGDAVLVHAGTYTGSWESHLVGTSGSPIIVRNYDNGRVTLTESSAANSTLRVYGNYVWFWGLELTCTDPVKQPYMAAAVNFMAVTGCQVINCIVHDTQGSAISNLNGSFACNIYGTLLTYNGRSDAGGMGGYGYGMYFQNQSGAPQKWVKECIVAYSWDKGLHSNAGASPADADNMLFEGNVVYNNGRFWNDNADPSFNWNFVLSDNYSCDYDTARNNYFYYPSSPTGGTREIWAYSSTGMTHFSYTGNYHIRGSWSTENCTSPAITGNTFMMSGDGFYGLIDGNTNNQSYMETNYPSNTYTSSVPNVVVVRPNAYEPKRAHIIVYNGSSASTVSANVSAVLSSGDTYVVKDALNYYGSNVASGTYTSGSITIPMTGLTAAIPFANSDGTPVPSTAAHTAPEFGAFILIGASGSGSQPTSRIGRLRRTTP